MELDVKLNINKIINSPNIAEMLDERALTTIGANVINEDRKSTRLNSSHT